MEGIAVEGLTQVFPTTSTPVNNYAGYVAGSATPFIGRDNTFCIVPIKYLPGKNEALSKARLR
jgi:hypothetical protein